MPTAHDVANELRKLADSLDKEPDTQIVNAHLHFYGGTQEQFLAAARLLPRPAEKRYGTGTDQNIYVEYKSDALIAQAWTARSEICRIVTPAQPAVYDCEPLLSPQEEAALTE